MDLITKKQFWLFDLEGTLIRTKSSDCIVLPGVKEFLEYLSDRGKKLAVVSNLIHYKTLEHLEKSGLRSYMNSVRGGIGSFRKPSPQPLKDTLTLMGATSVEHAIMIGDRPSDVIAARLAGCESVGLAEDASKHRLMQEVEAGYIFKNINALYRHLK